MVLPDDIKGNCIPSGIRAIIIGNRIYQAQNTAYTSTKMLIRGCI